MRFQKLTSALVVVPLTVIMLLGGSGAASAAENDAEVLFTEFVGSLDVSPETASSLQSEFRALSENEQEEFLAAVEEDPESVVNFGESTRTTLLSSEVPSQDRSVGVLSTYLAKNKVTGYVLGIAIGSFTTELKYEANATKVTRILTCRGSYAGFGLTGSARATNYISGTGRATCDVIYDMSVVIKDAPIAFAKQHVITTDSGFPSRYVATFKTY